MKKRIAWLLVLTLVLTCVCAVAMAATNGWQIVDNKYVMYYKNGKAVTGSQTIRENKVTKKYNFADDGHLMASGNVVEIAGETYFVGAGNILQEGFVTVNGHKYFFDANKRAVSGWLEQAGYYYYFDPTTKMAILNDGKTIDNQLCSFDANGILQSNGKLFTINGETIHLVDGSVPEPGVPNQKYDGWWTDVNGNRYYFGDYTSDDGTRHVGKSAATGGCYFLNSKEHFLFDSTGKQLFGFYNLNGNIYYYDFNSTAWATNPTAQPGCRCYQGFHYMTAEDKWYYFHEDGSAATGIEAVQVPGTSTFNYYYFNAQGQQEVGRVVVDQKIYFFNQPTGTTGTMITDGWYNPFGTDWYYLTVDGAYTGLQTIEDAPLGSGIFSKYYFNAEGCLQYRWIQLNGRMYYADPANNGKLVTEWQQIDGNWYYFDTDNNYALIGQQTLETRPGSALGAGKVYEFYFAGDGKLTSGLQTINGKKYYYDATQESIRIDGWMQIGPDWYYFAPAALTSTTKLLQNHDVPLPTVDQQYYEFDAEGKAKSANQGVTGFVTRLYQKLLRRTAEPAGVAFWTQKLMTGELDAATVVDRFTQMPEYVEFALTSNQTVDRLYETMLDRTPDVAGETYWADFLNRGMSETYVINGFSRSDEFGQLCYEYGIASGQVPNAQRRDISVGVTSFVMRCYQEALGRDGDVSGLNYWADLMLNGRKSPAQVAREFLASKEMANMGLTAPQYVARLYQLYMGREGTAPEIDYWAGLINGGLSRETVADAFAASPEFAEIVRDFGLN